METVTVTCPHCGFRRETSRSAIPPRTTCATCPNCSRRFAFSPGDVSQKADVLPPPDATSGTEALPEPPATDQPVRPPEVASPQVLAFTFTGRAGEYFGIWIVNTLLKILTAGIYSPWAKVRKRRYFYGNTLLHDSPFDYLADPLVLFKGWLIAATFFLLYTAGSHFVPVLGIVFALIFFLAMPWLVVRSRRYNALNSAHRNIRFSFRPAYREAYVVFAGLYLLVPFTLGLIIPYVIYRQKKFLVENGGYGSTPFTFTGTAGDFYGIYLKAFPGVLAMAGAFFLLTFFGIASFSAMVNKLGAFLAVAFYFLFLLAYFCIGVYLRTAVGNLTWNKTQIGHGRFFSTLRTRDLLWLYLSNAVAIACSFGLLTPWASVRFARYRFENLAFETSEGLDGFLARAEEEVAATGEEIGDLFGIEMDLAL